MNAIGPFEVSHYWPKNLQKPFGLLTSMRSNGKPSVALLAASIVFWLVSSAASGQQPKLKFGVASVFQSGESRVVEVIDGSIADVLEVERNDIIIALSVGRDESKKTFLLDSPQDARNFLSDLREMSAGLFKDASEGKYKYFETGPSYYSYNSGRRSYSFNKDQIKVETLDSPPSDYLKRAR